MGKHYEVVEFDDSSTVPTRRVVYSGPDEREADAWVERLRFSKSHQLLVDGETELDAAVFKGSRR